MPSDSDRLIAVKIFNIYPYSEVQQGLGVPQSFLVFLKGEENKVVPITIGQFEGQALAFAMRRIPLPRPLPHHLLQKLLEKMGARVHKLVIHTLKDDVFHAYLLIQTQTETFCLDCRPSDGMILATLLGTPIFMSPQVMADAGRVLELEQTQEEEAVEEDAPREAEAQREEKEIKEKEPLSELERLKVKLTRLIAEEAYEEAAKVRDQISQLEKG